VPVPLPPSKLSLASPEPVVAAGLPMLPMLALLKLRRSAASSADALLHLLRVSERLRPPPLPPSVERLLPPQAMAALALAQAQLADGVQSAGSPSHCNSKLKWKVEPQPSVLSTHTSPPIRCASRREIASPSPARAAEIEEGRGEAGSHQLQLS
jgi:hypothetical protein